MPGGNLVHKQQWFPLNNTPLKDNCDTLRIRPSIPLRSMGLLLKITIIAFCCRSSTADPHTWYTRNGSIQLPERCENVPLSV